MAMQGFGQPAQNAFEESGGHAALHPTRLTFLTIRSGGLAPSRYFGRFFETTNRAF